jgi:hypothetical protein
LEWKRKYRGHFANSAIDRSLGAELNWIKSNQRPFLFSSWLIGRFGLMLAFNAIAALTGIPISGALFMIPGKWSHGFGPMILFAGIVVTIGAAFYTAARVMMVGWKLNVKR